MKNNLSQLQIFKVQMYMSGNREKLCGRTIEHVQLTVQYAMGFNVNKSRILATAKMFNMPFSKSMKNKKNSKEKTLDEMFKQIHSLALAIKELYSDAGMKPRQEIEDIANCKRTKLR